MRQPQENRHVRSRPAGAVALLALGCAVIGGLSAREVGADPGDVVARPETAWQRLVATDPMAASTAGPLTRSVLTRISPESYVALREGTSAADIELLDGRPLESFLKGLGLGSGFAVPFFTVDGGGGRAAGGPFAVDSSIGQPDAGDLASGDLEWILLGGFREDLGNLLFEDGFESGDSSAWSAEVP